MHAELPPPGAKRVFSDKHLVCRLGTAGECPVVRPVFFYPARLSPLHSRPHDTTSNIKAVRGDERIDPLPHHRAAAGGGNARAHTI
jgi:hypothetical protein